MSTLPKNLTRRTADLPAKFRREGQWHLIPIYHLLQLSDLAREGIAHSGSYRFADHLYRGEPSGRGWLGRFIDRILLNLPAARGMRARCTQATLEMHAAFKARSGPGPMRILTVPCGIPRDVSQFAEQSSNAQIEYTGMDIDPAVLAAAREFLARGRLENSKFVQGDALDPEAWPAGKFDFISSTGLGEFLTDEELGVLYENVYQSLAPGGVFFTSAMAREPRADWLLRTFELRTNYRTSDQLGPLLRHRAWSSLTFFQDDTGLETFVQATR